MEKGTPCRIVLQKSILANSPKKGPQRYLTGESAYGKFETTTVDGGTCFWVDRVGDFVFFPPESISYDEHKKTPQELACGVVAEQKNRALEDPREWAKNLAQDVADIED